MEFRKLEKPVTVDKPIKVTFDEVWVSSDVRWNFFLSVIESIRTYFNTPDAVTLFALREFLQNAIDQEIVKNAKTVNDILNAYKKVKFTFTGKYYVIESEGDLPEESFELGYTTKTTVKLPNLCCLIGRFGIGFKQAIGALKQQGFNVIIQTAGHSYMLAGVCGDEVRVDKITGDCRIAILRGKSDVKGKTVIYAEGVEVKTNLLWGEQLRVSKTGAKVYHNGLYSGEWDFPFSVNLCCVTVDEYRTKVTPKDKRMVDILTEFFATLTPEERRIIVEAIKESAVVSPDMVHFKYPGDYNWYFTFYDIIADAIIELAKNNGINIIVIGDSYDTKYIKQINVKPFIFDGISLDSEIELVDTLRKKGYKAYRFEEYKKLVSKDALIRMSLPPDQIPEEIKAGIIAGRWAYNVAYRTAHDIFRPYRLLDDIRETEIYVMPDTFGEWNNNELGVTIYEGKPTVFLAPPKVLEGMTSSLPFSDKTYALWFVTMVVTFHELNHVFEPFAGHGTFIWEEVYYALLRLIQRNDIDTVFLSNILNLAFYNYKLLEGVVKVHGLEIYRFSPDVFVMLKTSNEVYVSVINNEVVPEVQENAQFKLVVEKEEDTLRFTLEPL